MIQLNDEYFENLTPEKLDEILDAARRKKDAGCAATFSPIGIRARKEQ